VYSVRDWALTLSETTDPRIYHVHPTEIPAERVLDLVADFIHSTGRTR